jgi:thiamine biosynthesis lipoprotein
MAQAVYRAVRFTVLAAALTAGCRGGAEPDQQVRVTATRRLMGMPWSITVYAASSAAGYAAIAAGFAEVARLERVLSDYDPHSELSRLSAQAPMAEPIPVSEDLWHVLRRAAELQAATDGAFDITVGPLTSLWRQARRTGVAPDADRLAAARHAVGREALALDARRLAVRLIQPGMRLDPGGIGAGYAADRALEVIERRGIAAALIDASGDVLVSAAPPGAAGWRIAVAPQGTLAEDHVVLTHAAITTSGDAHQAVEIAGLRHGHVIDPRTGRAVPGPAAVTVIAADCTTADALATAALVLGPEAGLRAVEDWPGCAARFSWEDGGQTRTQATRSWPGATSDR